MHVLFVNRYGFSYLGGVELHILNLGRELRRQGFRVSLLCKEERGEVGWVPKSDGIRVVCAPSLRAMAHFFRQEAAHIDVCHAHMSRKPYAVLGLLLARMRGIPTVFTPHCFYPSFGWATHAGKAVYDSTLGRFAFALADRVINLTPQDQRDAIELGMTPGKSVIIPNSVDFARLEAADRVFFRERYGIKNDFLLHVGRFARHKCVDFLVRNHAALSELNLDLVLIGQDDGELTKVCAQIKEVGLQGHVHILQSIAFEEVCAAFRGAVALVMASRYEGLPTVILEAAAFGTPSVAPRVGGIPFVIGEGKNGFLYDWGDQGGYVSAIRKIVGTKRRVAEDQKAEIVSRFSWQANAHKVAEIYQNLAHKTTAETAATRALRQEGAERGYDIGTSRS